MPRLRARTTIALAAAALAAVLVILTVAVVRVSVGESAAVDNAVSSLWTVAPLLIILAAAGGAILGHYLFRPLEQLQKGLAVSARVRAIVEPQDGEIEEITALRQTLEWVLRELMEEARVAESDKRSLAALIESVSEGIVEVGADGRFKLLNRAARDLLSLPPQPEGQAAAALIRNAELRTLIECAVQGEAAAPVEIAIDNRQLLIVPQPSSARSRGAGTAIITIVDLTQLRRLESVRRDFVANVSHELKTPLTSIRGYTETLQTDHLPREDQLQFLEVIHKNATRLQRIVEELLDLSRLESGGWTPALQDVEVTAAAREAWSVCEGVADRKRIAFSVCGDPAHMRADPSALQQIFTNIYDNAVRHTAEGGAIKVLISSGPHFVSTEIRDNGSGIPAALLPRIFERFFRVDAARSRAEGGTGLGLAIVKHLVERMGGSITATSAMGKGTSMHIQLPRTRA